MSFCSLLLATSFALGTATPSVVVARSAADAPPAAAVAVVAAPQHATQDEQRSYADREAAAPELGSFTGGDNVEIGVVAVVLAVLLLVIIL